MDGVASTSAGSRELFAANARTYDRVNTIISLGLDRRWRSWVARHAVTHHGARVLDAFSGTGLVGIRAAGLGAEVTLADISPDMLAVAEEHAKRRGAFVRTEVADLTTDDVAGGPFDAVTMVFGVRYLSDPVPVIQRLAGQLAPGGRFVVMDFVEPKGGVVSAVAAFYFFRILPVVAGLLAGRRELYRVLARTTHELGSRDHLERLVTDAGLRVVETRVMGFGMVVGIVARPPS